MHSLEKQFLARTKSKPHGLSEGPWEPLTITSTPHDLLTRLQASQRLMLWEKPSGYSWLHVRDVPSKRPSQSSDSSFPEEGWKFRSESLKNRLLHTLQSIFPNYLQLEASKAVISNCAQNHGDGSRPLGCVSELYRLDATSPSSSIKNWSINHATDRRFFHLTKSNNNKLAFT